MANPGLTNQGMAVGTSDQLQIDWYIMRAAFTKERLTSHVCKRSQVSPDMI